MSNLNKSRLEEKEELASLNDRLATYIEYVRDLKAEKSRLTHELHILQTSQSSGTEDAKALYEDELATIRRALDAEAKEKAEAHLEIGRLKEQLAEMKDLERENRRLTKENEELDAAALEAEAKAEAAEAQARREAKESKSLRAQLAKLRRELEALKGELTSAQDQLEKEQLNGVNLENENQSLREDIAFNKRLWETTFAEKKQMEVSMLTREQIDEDNKLKYAQRLHDALAEMRQSYEALMISFKEALGNQRRVTHRPISISASGGGEEVDAAELSAMKSMVDELTITSRRTEADLDEERQRVKSLNRRISSLEGTLGALKRSHAKEKEDFVMQITQLQGDYDNLQQAYEDMTLAKIRLDQEIEQYRILLTGEEQRLGLPASPSPGRPSSKKRKKGREEKSVVEVSASTKRQRLNESFTATADDIYAETETVGDVHIDELNLDGYYVKLSNTTQNPIKMDGFSLITRSESEDDAEYSFPKRFVLPAEGAITIWSESGKQFKEQGDLLWKKQESFYSEVGSEMALYDASGEVISYTTLKRAEDGEQEIFDSGTEKDDRRASCAVM